MDLEQYKNEGVKARENIDISQIKKIASGIINSFRNNGKLIVFGNGGSAADSQHFVAELTGHYMKERKALPAIALTTNTSALTAYSTFGYGIPIHSVIASTIESYTPTFANYTFNTSMAQKYLDLGGYSSGFSTKFYYVSGDPIGTAIATILQEELKAVNVTVTLEPVESATFDAQVGQGTYPMFYEGWVNLLATPADGMQPLFDSHNIGIYGNYNYFNNAAVTNDLVQAGTLYNQTQRDTLYKDVQTTLAKQAVEVPLFNLENVIPTTSNVHDLYIYPTFDIYIDQVTMGGN
jgi:ABC-type transport system substrate-binding protein